MRTERQKEQSRQSASRWYYANKKKAHAAARAWALKNPERRKEIANACARNAYLSNPEKFIEKRRLWSKANKEKENAMQRRWASRQRKTNPSFRIEASLRGRIWHALRGRGKADSFKNLLGCSVNELRSWLSGWFRPGMSWENYGNVWHIDHHKPCALFNLLEPEQQKQCFHYLNLRPLFAEENLRKGSYFQS